MTTLELVLVALCGIAALWVIALLVLDRLANDLLFGLLGLIELGLVVNLVLGIIRIAGSSGETSAVQYVGYLIGALFLLPAAVFWSLAERSRAGTAVLLVGILLVPFMCYRLAQPTQISASR